MGHVSLEVRSTPSLEDSFLDLLANGMCLAVHLQDIVMVWHLGKISVCCSSSMNELPEQYR